MPANRPGGRLSGATRELNQRFPDSEYSHYFNGVQQLQDGDYKGAEQSLRKARELGMPEESIAQLLKIAIDNQAWIWEYAQLTLCVLLAWLLGLVLLFIAGKALSWLTLTSIARDRVEIASSGERLLRRVYRCVVCASTGEPSR